MILLDTHIWYWWTNQIPGKLPPALVDLIENADEVVVSIISCFEMAWLVRHGRIELDVGLDEGFAEVEASKSFGIFP